MLVSKSSTDLDGISIKLLKAVRAEIESPLAHAFNLSLTTGEFPQRLKASKIVPIHKAGDRTNCDNYRPITLVNAFSKVLEKSISQTNTPFRKQPTYSPAPVWLPKAQVHRTCSSTCPKHNLHSNK
jgi:hypothetical protein